MHPTAPRPLAPSAQATLLVAAGLLPLGIAFVCSYLLAGQSVVRLAYVAAKTVQLGLPLVATFMVEGRTLRVPRPRAAGLALAAIYGVVVLGFTALTWGPWFRSALIAAGIPEMLRFKLAAYGITSGAGFVLLALYYVAPHTLAEEYYWRWFFYGRLRTILAPGPAIAVAGLAWTVHHAFLAYWYVGAQWGFVATFASTVLVSGWFWAWLYERSGQLYAPWLGHALVEIALLGFGWDLWRG